MLFIETYFSSLNILCSLLSSLCRRRRGTYRKRERNERAFRCGNGEVAAIAPGASPDDISRAENNKSFRLYVSRE